MGQINSVQDGENAPQTSQNEGEQNEREREQQREANSEQVRCVKTRIDMLIEDCLNTKDSTSESEGERYRNKDIMNINHMICKSGNGKRKENDSRVEKVSETETAKKIEGKGETSDTQESDKNENADCKVKHGEKEDQAEEKKVAKKEEIKLSDIITDMVNTELTEKQLKHIQQRTITTFNTFIDKVLDNSLNQENTKEEKHKPTNILKLCSESMIPEKGRKSEENTNDSDRNEKPECDRDVVKTDQEKKITLKDHIERFLELSFRDENTKEENISKKNSNLQENFNAQGLVNSMITQGIQINRLLTTKEQQNSVNQKTQKELEIQKKQMKYPEQNLRPKSHEMYGQKSPNSNNVQDRQEVRYNHAVSGQQMADAKFREHYFSQTKYEPGNRNSQIPLGYGRRDEMLERNREMQAKMNVNVSSKHEMNIPNHMRTSDHSSAFHQPHHLQVANNAYYNPAYMPRMQMSPGQLRDMKTSMRGENKQVHVRDCMCAMCLPQPHSRHGKMDPTGIDQYQGKRSPNVPHQFQTSSMAAQTPSGLVREVPAMMRPSHSELPPGMVAYQGMHKLLPHHPPITSSKVYSGGQMLVPGEMTAQGMVPSRQLNMPENPQYVAHYSQRRGDEYPQNSANNERLAVRSGKQSPYHARPSSLPPHEHNSPIYARPGSGHLIYESDYSRHTDSSSCASDCSNEAPLDLTVKKPKIESARSRSSSNASSVRRINPSNSFIKHLESSVDKYWQELSSPPSSPVNTKPPTQMNRAPVTSTEGRNVPHVYPQQSPNGSSPPGLMSMIQNRPLPSPHYTGGITVGQPLVDMKPPVTQKQTEYNSQTGTQMVNNTQQQSQFQGNQSGNFDLNSKRSANNVSKHEPLQNLIGNHDPNDILYLICRLCTQTYGNSYGFKKHFRNQHGFEPRAEHTIVQTISATKSALHFPQPQLMQGMAEIRESHFMRKSISPESEMINQKRVTNTHLGRKSSSESPVDSKSCTGSEEGEKGELENTETKCLECPECGKTFQLNDFGSYKRHCRQHGNIRTNGPFTCTDCHLPFPDQKSLREHYKVHVKDSVVVVSQEQKVEESAHKLESHQTFYMCVKCDQQYDNVDTYKKHLASHETETKLEVDIESVPIKQTTVSMKSENEPVTDIVSSKTVVKQEAESNTLLACPDSSWDNVPKAVATSNKLELNLELSESNNSNMSNSSEKSNNKEEDKTNIPVVLTPQKSVESGSENEKKGEDNEFTYIHKKFFHHRKRASSSHSISNDATDVKQAKISPEVPASVTYAADNTATSSSTPAVANSSCDSTGSSGAKVEETVDTDKGLSVKSVDKAPEKPAKTEARHSLPFVWDRTTRSQKKL